MKKRKTANFNALQLPQTRKDQYFFLLKNQYWNLLKIGFLSLAFFLPFLLLAIARDILNSEFLKLCNDGTIELAEYHTYFLLNTVGSSLIAYFFLPFLAVGLAGFNRLFRFLVEGEPLLMKGDFFAGVRMNYKRTLQGLLFFGAFFFLHTFAITYFQSPIIIVPSFIFILLLIVPIFFVYSAYSSYYEDKFIMNLVNSIRLYGYSWWQFLLLASFAIAAYYGVDSIPDYYLKSAISSIAVALVFPLFSLLVHEIAICAFDKAINAHQFPERAYLGLYNPQKKPKEKNL